MTESSDKGFHLDGAPLLVGRLTCSPRLWKCCDANSMTRNQAVRVFPVEPMRCSTDKLAHNSVCNYA